MIFVRLYIKKVIFVSFLLIAIINMAIAEEITANDTNNNNAKVVADQDKNSTKTNKIESTNVEKKTKEISEGEQLQSYGSQDLTTWINSNKKSFDNIVKETAKDSKTMWNVSPQEEAQDDSKNEANASAPETSLKQNDDANDAVKKENADIPTLPKEGKSNDKVGEKHVATKNTPKLIKHKVAQKETLSSISRFYQVKVTEIKKWNKLQSDSLQVGQIIDIYVEDNNIPQNALKLIKHKVVKKETLSSLSRLYKIKVADIKKWNKLQSNSLKVGQILDIYIEDNNNATTHIGNTVGSLDNKTPDTKTPAQTSSTENDDTNKNNKSTNFELLKYTYYRVKKGDSYQSIAKDHGMAVKELLSLNKLKYTSVLSVDSILKVKTNYVKEEKYLSALKDGFTWPIVGKLLITFGTQSLGMRNEGINIASRKGTPVKAVQKGVVIYTGDDLSAFGHLILIQHNEEWISIYGHLGKILVKKGQHVKKGAEIGKVGDSGDVSQPQLHFELRYKLTPMDPLKYLNSYR